MSFDVPGYYFDKKRNRLFKITSTGPYSLAEIRKRLKAEEEEAAAAKKKKRQQQEKPIPNINQFVQQRALLGSNIKPTHPGMVSLTAHLKEKQCLRLDGPKETYQNVKVDVDDENNEFIVSDKRGVGRFGYQCEPRFYVWASGFIGDSHYLGNVTSLNYKKQREQMHVTGTATHPQRGGLFFEYAIKKQPPLTQDEVATFNSIRNNDSILGIPNSHIENVNSIPLFEYRIKKDTFWSSAFDAFHGTTIIGGEKKIHIIDNGFEHAHSQYMNSDVFAIDVPDTTRRNECWVGLRNGTVGSIDLRTPSSESKQHRNKNRFNFKLKASSSITNIRCLSNGPTGNEVLVACLDGSVSIYDKRKPQKNPIRQLLGHHNETYQHLGFDIDEKNNMLMLAGDDGYVRIWSLFRTKPEPIFTSKKYASPVPAVSFVNNNLASMSQSHDIKLPGIAFFGACPENKPFAEIQYFSAL